MISRYNRISEMSGMKTFSTRNIRRLLYIGLPLLNTVVILLLILYGFVL